MGKVKRPDTMNPRDFGNSRERAIKKTGGYTHTPNSGAGAVKGDLRRGDFMIEVKATRHDSYPVSREVMSKLRNDGLTNGRKGVLIVELGDGSRYAVMSLDLFETLTEPDA